jgi:hypothetical protein
MPYTVTLVCACAPAALAASAASAMIDFFIAVSRSLFYVMKQLAATLAPNKITE